MTIELTAHDDGTTVVARPGDDIVVVLPENATTGYRWQVERADDPLTLTSDGYPQVREPEGAEVQFGRGGLREFRFHVSGPGTALLVLKHWQEWEGERSVIRRVTFTIEASPYDLAE